MHQILLVGGRSQPTIGFASACFFSTQICKLRHNPEIASWCVTYAWNNDGVEASVAEVYQKSTSLQVCCYTWIVSYHLDHKLRFLLWHNLPIYFRTIYRCDRNGAGSNARLRSHDKTYNLYIATVIFLYPTNGVLLFTSPRVQPPPYFEKLCMSHNM